MSRVAPGTVLDFLVPTVPCGIQTDIEQVISGETEGAAGALNEDFNLEERVALSEGRLPGVKDQVTPRGKEGRSP